MVLRRVPHVTFGVARAWLGPICVLLSACGGAKDQDVLAESSSGASSSSSSSGASSGSTGGSSGSSNGSVESGSDAAAACLDEDEPNNRKNSANALSRSRCGAVQPAGDTDFLTFKLQEGTKTISLKYEGKITLTVSVDGASTVVLGGGGNQVVPFVQGKPYFIEIRSSEKAARVPWRVDLLETP